MCVAVLDSARVFISAGWTNTYTASTSIYTKGSGYAAVNPRRRRISLFEELFPFMF